MGVRRMLVAGRYQLREPVGSGGMGRVWLARDEMLDRDVAVKEFVPPQWMTEAEKDRLRDRTLREARSAGRLNHPHVVRVYDVVHEDGRPWIVMEYVPSRSLFQVIHEDGPYSPGAAARIGLAVLDALTAAHQAGVLHRDVKPHNVLIGTDGQVVLTDFGLATFMDDSSVTGPGLVVGSPQYVSPERARDGASTVESDLWSFGATLYATVEGRSPYARESAMATLMALATEEPDPAERAGPLAPVLIGLLRHDPGARLTAAEVHRRLHMIIAAPPESLVSDSDRSFVPCGTPAAVRVVPPGQRRPAGPVRPAGLPADRSAVLSADRSAVLSAEGSAAAPAVRHVMPPTVPARPRPAFVVAALALVAAIGGVGVASYLVQQRNDAGSAPSPVPSSTPEGHGAMVAAGFSPAVCNGPAQTAPRLPQRGAARGVSGFELLRGWSYFTDGTGFHMPVPDDWTWEKVGTTYCFRDPAGDRVLSLDTGRPAGEPLKACLAEESRLVGQGTLPGYERIRIAPKPLLNKAADWEYRYDDPFGVPLHALTRWFTTAGRAYAISWATREIDWTADLAKIDMILISFYADRPTSWRPG